MSKGENMQNKRLREGNTVVVIAGNEKGQSGKILARKGDRFIVEGLNIRKKHARRSETNPNGIIEMEAPIHASNLMLLADGDKGVRLKVRKTEEGNREVYYRKDGDTVAVRTLSKAKKN